MKFINVDWEVPYRNFALEAYLLEEAPKDQYLFFYIHKPSIIIGRHQNAWMEVNASYVEDNNIILARRMSGGGAVYHDHGNLNFSFIMPGKKEDVTEFASFTAPIVQALNNLGIEASLSGRNDLQVDGKKFSGNAQCYKNGRLLRHGTLLVDVNTEVLQQALTVRDIKIRSKGVQSVASRITNLKNYLPSGMDVYGLRAYLLEALQNTFGLESFTLSSEALAWIENKEGEFAEWAWNWGKSPKADVHREAKFDSGLVDLYFDIQSGTIQSLQIYGDFFTWEDIHVLASRLHGIPYQREAVNSALADIDVERYIPGVSAKMLGDLIFYES